MCFSAQADLVGGVLVGAIGVDAVRHVSKRHGQLALASLPLVFGAHQVDEAFVWWGLQGHVPTEVGRVALWVYLLIALVALPVFVPVAVVTLEPARRRKWLMCTFVILGVMVAAVLLLAILRGPIAARLQPYHVAYLIRLGHGGVIVGLYVVAVCGALLLSSYRHVRIFGLANLVAVGVLAPLTVAGFASLWCAYAAITSGAIAAHLRFAKSHRAQPYLLS